MIPLLNHMLGCPNGGVQCRCKSFAQTDSPQRKTHRGFPPSLFQLPAFFWGRQRQGHQQICLHLHTWMVDFYGIDVGEYTSPMDPIGMFFSKWTSLEKNKIDPSWIISIILVGQRIPILMHDNPQVTGYYYHLYGPPFPLKETRTICCHWVPFAGSPSLVALSQCNLQQSAPNECRFAFSHRETSKFLAFPNLFTLRDWFGCSY